MALSEINEIRCGKDVMAQNLTGNQLPPLLCQTSTMIVVYRNLVYMDGVFFYLKIKLITVGVF